MVAVLAFLWSASIPAGAYALPELCRELQGATGVAHSIDPELRDYPVSVSVNGGSAKRIEELVAVALRAKWKSIGDREHLVPEKVDPSSEFEEFDRQYRLACGKDRVRLALPVKDLYRMRIGSMIRYAFPQNSMSRPLPEPIRKPVVSSNLQLGFVSVMRQAEGIFCFREVLPRSDTYGEVKFNALPESLANALEDRLNEEALAVVDQQRILAVTSSPKLMNSDWQDLKKRDPTAALANMVMKHALQKANRDVVVALPDLAFFAAQKFARGPRSLRALLEAYSAVVNWDLHDGAVVGKLPIADRLGSPQARRSALAEVISKSGTNSVLTGNMLGDFVRLERPAASDSLADIIVLAMTGVSLDDEFAADYPYNVRLWSSLNREDWNVMAMEQPVLASRLSSAAQTAVYEFLTATSHCLEPGRTDAAFWRSLESSALEIRPTYSEETVLIGWTGLMASVQSVAAAARNYDLRRNGLAHEPLYQPAIRKRLKIAVAPVGVGISGETGCGEVVPLRGASPSPWSQLPPRIVTEFRAELQNKRSSRGEERGKVPPP